MPKTKVRFFLSEPSANFSDPRACLKIKALFKIHFFFFFFHTISCRWSPMALKTKAKFSLRSDPTCFLWGMRASGCICTSSKATRSCPSGETWAFYSFSMGNFLWWLWHPTPPVAAAGGQAAAHTGTCAAGPGAPRLSPDHWQPPASSAGCAASSKCHLACYDFVLRYQGFFPRGRLCM